MISDLPQPPNNEHFFNPHTFHDHFSTYFFHSKVVSLISTTSALAPEIVLNCGSAHFNESFQTSCSFSCYLSRSFKSRVSRLDSTLSMTNFCVRSFPCVIYRFASEPPTGQLNVTVAEFYIHMTYINKGNRNIKLNMFYVEEKRKSSKGSKYGWAWGMGCAVPYCLAEVAASAMVTGEFNLRIINLKVKFL